MTNRRRAEPVRQKLMDIMSREEFLKASTQTGISRTAVEILKKEAPNLVAEHQDEQTDIGLMHTAGSTKSTAIFTPSNDNANRQFPLFFTIMSGESEERARPVRTTEITPEEYFKSEELKSQQTQRRKHNVPRTSIQSLRDIAEEMRDKGYEKMTIGEYLNRG